MNTNYDLLCKMIVVGDAGTGKSCLTLRYTQHEFCENYINTIGVEVKLKTLNVGGSTMKMQIWDTAGQERFRAITSSFYRGASGIMIVFDVTNRNSFLNVGRWIEDCSVHSSADAVRILISEFSLGTKLICHAK
eukprot:TRINITY_DN14_c0_g1_i12.p1 TRINITY_DN14_c0_g1~~TRINITY_DN14_c0_g1_i12.p1  ORF type:complete len:134 (-),score=24.22 TRINITY_DN14_c0_g1_i12:253-654(-)